MFTNTRKDQIAKAMYELLQNETIEEVSVREIIDAAEISRRTFYNHFADKFEVMTYIFDKLDAEYGDTVGSQVYDTMLVRDITNYFYMFTHKKFFLNTYCYSGQNSLLDYHASLWNKQIISEIRSKHQNSEISEELLVAINTYTYGTICVLYAMLRGIIPIPDSNIPYASIALPKVLYDALYTDTGE